MSWICFTLAEFRLLCLCTSRLNLLATRICSHSFAPSVRKSANVLTTLKAAFTLAEGRLACTTTQATAKAAFTLAEVLITLAIIGVVAVLTVPALIQNYNEKAWETAKSVFEKRLEVAVKQLNTEEKLF